MKKMRISQRDVKEGYRNIISIGYCELQTLLRFEGARYYTAGVYGWNADIYEIDYQTVIVTGYRPMKGNIEVDRKTLKKYEEKAREYKYNYDKTYEQNRQEMHKLLDEFIKEVMKTKEEE